MAARGRAAIAQQEAAGGFGGTNDFYAESELSEWTYEESVGDHYAEFVDAGAFDRAPSSPGGVFPNDEAPPALISAGKGGPQVVIVDPASFSSSKFPFLQEPSNGPISFEDAYKDFITKRQKAADAVNWASSAGTQSRFQELTSKFQQLSKKSDVQKFYAKYGVDMAGSDAIIDAAADITKQGNLDAEVDKALKSLYAGLNARAVMRPDEPLNTRAGMRPDMLGSGPQQGPSTVSYSSSFGQGQGYQATGQGAARDMTTSSRTAGNKQPDLSKRKLVAGHGNGNDLGLRLNVKGTQCIVSDVKRNSWADKASVKIGDELVEVNGISMADITLDEVQQKMTLFSRPVELAFVPITARMAKPGQSLANKQRDVLMGLLDVTERLETWLSDRGGGQAPAPTSASPVLSDANDFALHHHDDRAYEDLDAFGHFAGNVGSIDDDLKQGLLGFMSTGDQPRAAAPKAGGGGRMIKIPQQQRGQSEKAVRLQV